MPPNKVIIAKIELVDFEEGDVGAVLSSPHKIKKRDHKELLEKHEKLKRGDYYANGESFWDFMKKGKGVIDFQSFEKCFVQGPQQEFLFADDNERDQFINDLEWVVLLKEKMIGEGQKAKTGEIVQKEEIRINKMLSEIKN